MPPSGAAAHPGTCPVIGILVISEIDYKYARRCAEFAPRSRSKKSLGGMDSLPRSGAIAKPDL